MSNGSKDQLDGWKEIAAYLGRDERTAKRWEKQRGLPVRRIPGGGRSNVYVLVSEVEAWLSPERPSLPEESAEAHHLTREAVSGIADAPSIVPLLAEEEVTVPLHDHNGPTMRVWGTGLTLAVLVLGGYTLHKRFPERRTPTPQETASAPASTSPRAATEGDEQYLQAVYLLEQRTPDSLESALRAFSHRVEQSPNDARAYAKIAITYLLLREYSLMPQKEAYLHAKAMAQQALTIDPNLSEAHAALGFVDFFSEWKPEPAAEHFRTAIRLNPACVLAHHWYGSMLMHQARFPEALQELTIAQRYEPTSPAILSSKALALGLGGHRAEAIAMLQTLTRVDPNAAAPHHYLASLSLLQPRDVPQYIEEMRRFSILRKDSQQQILMKKASLAYRRGGERAVWKELLAAARKEHPIESAPSFARAEAEALLGERDHAMADLSRLSEQHDPEMIGVLIAASLDPLRNDPRLPEVIHRVGLIEE